MCKFDEGIMLGVKKNSAITFVEGCSGRFVQSCK